MADTKKPEPAPLLVNPNGAPPAPAAQPLGVPQEGDRASRFVGGPSDVAVKKGTVTI